MFKGVDYNEQTNETVQGKSKLLSRFLCPQILYLVKPLQTRSYVEREVECILEFYGMTYE